MTKKTGEGDNLSVHRRLLSETEAFRTFRDGHNQHGAKFIVSLIRGKIQLVETGAGTEMHG